MKVGLVSPYDLRRWGGVQNQVLELERLLREHGDEPLVIGPGGSGVDLGASVQIRANGSVVPLRLDPRVRQAVRAAAENVDVIHVHEPFVPMVGWAAWEVDRPLVATFHADAPTWVKWLYRLMPDRSWRSRVVTAVSPVAADLPWTGVRIIPNGLRVEAFRSGKPRHRQRVAFFGRDEPRKGLDVLQAAWPEVHRAVPSAELLVNVEGEDRNGVRFLGSGVEHQRKVDMLVSSAIFVAPNRGGESFGMTVAEAMAAGCAIVASDLPAFRDVTAGTAWLCPPGESRPLAAALVELLTSPTAAEAMGRRARERVEMFDWRSVFPLYRAAYEEARTRFAERAD